ncbi:hypothetical protein AWZ03_008631 [Drosophila navojoa]|uniref:G-protein coupled receptors family 2 profile 2 domain-containing protein n=1 Tax=Drosophila navojoa TaxID=7232 RepID=A0A484BAB6_DRONA|nr:hypothetical protein AWZ03_008631 [Drosophila navojoa]
MAEEELQAFVESLDGASAENIANAIANFSLDMLQRASALIGTQQPHSGALLINRTLEEQCRHQAELERRLYSNSSSNVSSNVNSDLHCPTSFDSVLCWPRTKASSWAVLSCFEEFKGVHYDTTGENWLTITIRNSIYMAWSSPLIENATRYCHANGTWNHYSNYSRCHQQSGSVADVPEFSASVDLPAIIYAGGYFISFATLVVALIIFLSFKDLRCLRNTIHANLFLTYITSALLWILTLFLQVITTESSQAGCITLVIIFQYFYLTNFFWMFVEGLYLYILVVQTFSSENISFVIYALIGWGCPALCILVWSIAKAFASHLENDHFNGYYKASKALLVLIPLFGITYLLVLTGPEQGISRNLFEALRAFLLSTQGFFVALFYCFLNSEVRQTLRHRFVIWRESRNIHRSNSRKNRRLTSTSPVPAGHLE